MGLNSRNELAKMLAGEGDRKGAEVGVFKGRFSEILCKLNPELELFCVDIWQGSWGEGYTEAMKRLKPLNTVILPVDSVEAAKGLADESLDFVYIDAAHDYDNVMRDLKAWYPKLKKGGILAGDDYYHFRSGNNGVIKAVDDFCKDMYDLQTTEWDDDNEVEDDRQPQWWFIK